VGHPLRLMTPRATLRDFLPTDVEGLLGIVDDERVTRWPSFDNRDRDRAERMIGTARAAASAQPRTECYVGVASP